MKKQRKNSSDYTHSTGMIAMVNFLFLIDLDLGNRSLTNDIDKAVEEVLIKIDPANQKDYRVVYKDSSGEWNAFFKDSGQIMYVGVSELLPREAAEKYLMKFELILN